MQLFSGVHPTQHGGTDVRDECRECCPPPRYRRGLLGQLHHDRFAGSSVPTPRTPQPTDDHHSPEGRMVCNRFCQVGGGLNSELKELVHFLTD